MNNIVNSVLTIILIGWISSENSDARGYLLPGKNINDGEFDSLRYDGVYALYDTAMSRDNKRKWFEIHEIYSPLIVINKKNATFLNYMNFVDSSVLRLESHEAQGKDFGNYVGTYYVLDDTIFAALPTRLIVGGGRTKLFLANYKGIIKNRDTIINWQLVPPYPKVNMKTNSNLEKLRTPHLLYFIESKELSGLNSLYEKM